MTTLSDFNHTQGKTTKTWMTIRVREFFREKIARPWLVRRKDAKVVTKDKNVKNTLD